MTLTRKELLLDWPCSSHDVDGAARLLRHGASALDAVLPDMVQWLQSSGPLQAMFGEHLSKHGATATEAVRKALGGRHDGQIEFLLRHVLPNWSVSDLSELQPELEMLLQRGSLTGLNIYALRLLSKTKASTHASLDEWARLFRRSLDEQTEAMNWIEAELSQT